MIRLGAVPYVNALPFTVPIEGRSRAEIMLDVPSRLPGLLSEDRVDAILVSSIFALTQPDLVCVEGTGIASSGAVQTVKLICGVEPVDIRSMRPDPASMTSNALAQIILAECYGVRLPIDSTQERANTEADCRVIIGDPGMYPKESPGEIQLDLGEEWFNLTGLPFTYALWVAKTGIEREVGELLRSSIDEFYSNPDDVLASAVEKSGWSEDVVRRYLFETIDFRLEARHMQGLSEFASLLTKHRLVDEISPIKWI